MHEQSQSLEDENRPQYRNLESQTTIPFGHVDEQDLNGAMECKYNQPLWKCLFVNQLGDEVDVESLLAPTAHWFDCRLNRKDIATIDPDFEKDCEKALELRQCSDEKCDLVAANERKREREVSKIDAAVEAMVAMQIKKVQETSTGPVEESPLFKVNKKNIDVWRENKIQVLDKAHECVIGNAQQADDAMRDFVESMLMKAYEIWKLKQKETSTTTTASPPEVDPDLFGELESILESPEHDVTWFNYVLIYLYVLPLSSSPLSWPAFSTAGCDTIGRRLWSQPAIG